MARAATKKKTPKRAPRKTTKKTAGRPRKAAAGSRHPSMIGQVIGAFRDIRASFEAQMSAGYGEERLLAYVAIACLLAFVAGLPAGVRDGTFADDGQFLPGLIAGRFVAMVLFGPLFLYGVAALSHIVSVWTFGGKGDYFRARVAFFWSLVLGIPIILIQTIALEAIDLSGLSGLRSMVSFGIGVFWLWIWSTGIAVAEGFSRAATFLFVMMAGVVILGLTILLSA